MSTRRTSRVLADLIAVANQVLPKPGAAVDHALSISSLKDEIQAAIRCGDAGTGAAILSFALMHLACERMVLVEVHHLVEIARHARELVRENLQTVMLRELSEAGA
jgi:predicted RNA methylase